MVGLLFHLGWGIEQSDEQAIKYFKKAASLGHGPSQFNLGVFLFKGLGTAQNLRQALKWIKQAEKNNIPEAKKFLSLLKKKRL